MAVVVPTPGNAERRTILAIIQRAAPKIGLTTPAAIFSATDATAVELAAIANEVMERIVRAHDWSRLKLEHQMIGDGASVGYSLPADYLRMPKDGRVWSMVDRAPLTAVQNGDDWLRLSVEDAGRIRPAWIILNGQMQFAPAPVDGDVLRFLYVSRFAVTDEAGGLKTAFTADTDAFVLDARVLELGMIWEWRNRKGLPYAEDMATAETALAQAISDDAGAHVLTQRSGARFSASPAYPWAITP